MTGLAEEATGGVALGRLRIDPRWFDWIWHIRGSVPLAPGQSDEAAFAALLPLFRQPGTTHQVSGDTLTFRKRDQAAQDKMAVFDDGTVRVEQRAEGRVLRYHMTSRALLFCFLAPFLFLAFAQVVTVLGRMEKASTEAAEKAGKKKDEKKDKVLPQSTIDKMLGAPVPKKPGEDKKKEEGDEPSPKAAYVFAGIFAALYVVGRFLEEYLIRSLFRKRLHGA